MNILPINNLVFIEPKIETSKGVLALPPGVKLEDKVYEGVVHYVGPKATGVKPGDRILHGKWTGTATKVEGVDYLVMKDEDVLCVVEDDEVAV